MRLQRVGGHARIIAPDLVQQHIARHHALGARYRNFRILVSFSVNRILRHPRSISIFIAGLNVIGPKLKDSILGLFMLAQLRADTGQQHRKLERLGDVVIRACIQPKDRIGILSCPVSIMMGI
jgi:hypothetical protein